MTISRVTPEIDGVATYQVELADAATAESYSFLPGQFNMLYLPGAGEIAISLSGNPRQPHPLLHTVRVAGNVTRTLAGLDCGSGLGLRGPFGSSWPLQACVGCDVVIVAGGIGLAPLRPAIYELMHERSCYGRLWLLYGARTPDGMLFTNEYGEWKSCGLTIQTTVDRADASWQGNVGVVPLLLDRLPLDRPEHTAVLACGPEVMMWYTVQSAMARGIPPERIWLSLERNMNCAIGLCGHCQFGPEFICKDGPVLRYDCVAPFLKVEGF